MQLSADTPWRALLRWSYPGKLAAIIAGVMDTLRIASITSIALVLNALQLVRKTENRSCVRRTRLPGLLLCVVLGVPGAVFALDANGGNGNNGSTMGAVTMDDVARMIRRTKNWEILDARPRQKGNETRYRFKLINSTGKVKIINVDPRKPSLKKLDQ
jgi:hypothetical protein